MALTTEIRISEFRSAAQEVALTTAPSEAVGMAAAPSTFFDTLVDTFMPSANADPSQTANVDAKPSNGVKEVKNWKPQAQLDNSKVATGVQQSNNGATAMQADAKEGLASVQAAKQDLQQQGGAPDAKSDANGANIAGMGRGLAFEAAAVGAVGLAAGPAAAAALGGMMLAKDMFSAVAGGAGNDPRVPQGGATRTVTLSREERREAAKNGGRIPDEASRMKSGPTNSFEAQAKAAQGEDGYGRSNNPVLEALSEGPGFGPKMDSADLGARSSIAHDSLTDMNYNQLQVAEAAFTNQLNISDGLKAGLTARANNGVEVMTKAETGNVSASLLQESANKNTAFVPGQYA